MTTTAIKKQVNEYLPLLTSKQQELVLEMIKSLLQMEEGTKRVSKKKYNKEINEAASRIDQGKFVSHKEALQELSKW